MSEILNNVIYAGGSKPKGGEGGGGGTGTSNYADLTNKPRINGVTLIGDKTTEDLGIVISGGSDNGLRGDYETTYGIIECPNGLIDYSISSNRIMIKSGIQLLAWGNDTKVMIASDTPHDVLATRDFTLVYVDGEFLECDVFYQTAEPENGSDLYIAWWNGEKWQFKSNDTGNVWRTPEKATPIADIHINDGVINRIDYVGYRVMNDEIYITQEVFETREQEVDTELETLSNNQNELGDQVHNIEAKIPSSATSSTPLVSTTDLDNKLVPLTQSEYEALLSKDSNTFYFIKES